MLRYLYRLPDLYQAGKWRLAQWTIDLELRRFRRAMAEWETLSDEEKHRRNERAMERRAAEWAAMQPNLVLDVLCGVVSIVLFGLTLWHCWPQLSFHVGLGELGQQLLAQAKMVAIVAPIVAVMLWLEGKFKLPPAVSRLSESWRASRNRSH